MTKKMVRQAIHPLCVTAGKHNTGLANPVDWTEGLESSRVRSEFLGKPLSRKHTTHVTDEPGSG